MAVFHTEYGRRAATQNWFDPSWYSVLLASNPDEGNLPANRDNHPAFYSRHQLLPGNGYPGVLGPYVFPEPVQNGALSRWDQPNADQSFTASGGDVTYRGFFLVRGHKGLPPQSTSLSGQTFTTSSHGFSVGDKIIVVSDGGSLPTGYTEDVTYKVATANTNTLTIANLDDSSVSLSSSGSNLFLIPCDGAWSTYEDFDADQVVGDGQTQDIGHRGFATVQGNS
ncbi:MAG: hypothetical protein AAGA67_14260 [Cyanobacteria bacterium P01_F01_bin.153]